MAPVMQLDLNVTDVTPKTWNQLSGDLSAASSCSSGSSCDAGCAPCCTHCGEGNCGCCI